MLHVLCYTSRGVIQPIFRDWNLQPFLNMRRFIHNNIFKEEITMISKEKKQAEQQTSEKRDPGDGDDARFVPQRLGFRDERKKEHAKRTGDSRWKQKQRQYHSA